MIDLNELLMNRAKLKDLDKETQDNLTTLLERINKVRGAYGKPMKVNDGYRRPQDTPPHGAKKSKHLLGAAVDIDDDEAGTLWNWLMKPEQMTLLKGVGLWLEHGCYTHCNGQSWVHLQILPPASGKRIFIPSAESNPNPKFWSGVYDIKFD